MRDNRSARQTYARLFRRASTIAMPVVAVAVLFWPTRARQVERFLSELSEGLACDGPLPPDRENSLGALLGSHLSQDTTMSIANPEAINGVFTRDELVHDFSAVCMATTHFRVTFSQVAVDANEHGANARADVVLQYVYAGRTARERRQARFTLRLHDDAIRLSAVEVGPDIVIQPEPRP